MTDQEAREELERIVREEYTLITSRYIDEEIVVRLARDAAEKRFVEEVKAAEESIDSGHYVTLFELHEFLGV